MGRLAGTTDTGVPATAPAGGGTITVVFANDGMNFETGSLEQELAFLEQDHRSRRW